MPTHPFPPSKLNALASGLASGFGSRVARLSGILFMPDASANGSQTQAWLRSLINHGNPQINQTAHPTVVIELGCPQHRWV